MISTRTDVALTDDEVAAFAFLQDQARTRPLPTVDLNDQHQVNAAIARGLRSLNVRGLTTSEGELSQDLTAFSAVAAAPARLGMYALQDGVAYTTAAALELISDGEVAVVVFRSVLGVHSCVLAGDPQAEAYFRTMSAQLTGDDAEVLVLVEVGAWLVRAGTAVPAQVTDGRWRSEGKPVPREDLLSRLWSTALQHV
ncbi:hypothetical protein [Yimella sp. cx-51]|uniref:hypothetical protein n=1 Tax=Yimella sp. cx-51 TaxID=2770551 RepID=UPI00165DBCB8|nr:hypothetical protein [Yimella sp. cx-51]MBC9955947.1 hypothetical protein [Yimella sp. cx-51]QTH37513.1 hypothetical protein J5M86_11605 [Yimella sp. cx-51]